MNIDVLNQKLIKACDDANLDEIQKMIISGANPNLLDKYGESIFEHVFIYAVDRVEDETEISAEEYNEIFNRVKNTVKTLVNYGWNIQKYGLRVMHQFIYMSNQKLAFDLMKFFLAFNLGDEKSEYESLLEGIGTEESYQRCCDNNHVLENILYTMYEIVNAKMENRSYKNIELYYDAIGMKIDKILYLGKESIVPSKAGATKYNDDICFVCGEKILVIRECVNILFINDITNEEYVEIPNLFGNNIIGSKIVDVSFEHKEIVDGITHYGQPTIVVSLDSGKKLKFTHNFGEHNGDKVQSSFVVV